MNRRDLLKASGVAVGVAAFPWTTHAGLTSPLSSNPVLPQYDTVVGSLARTAALAAARLNYQWTLHYPFLDGFPMALGAPVPIGEQPAIDWLLKVGVDVANLLVNALVSVPNVAPALGGQFAVELQQLASIQTQLDQANQTFQQWMGHPLSVTDAASMQTSLLGILTQLGAVYTSAQGKIDTFLEQQQTQGNQGGDLPAYDAAFGTFPLPEIASHLRDDDFFVNLRVAGGNPLLITQVSALPDKLALTEAQYHSVMGPGDSLASAAATKRLYLVDYVDMGPLANARPGRYITDPIVVLALTPARDALLPVAIQLGQATTASNLFLRVTDPASPGYWGWQMAKTAVQEADFLVHEPYSHLSRTHMLLEAFAIATHRQLPPEHPLYVLLLPHFEGTMFINAGVPALLAPHAFLDLGFAPAIQTTTQAVLDDRLSFDVYAHMLPTQLARRGVANPAELPVYPYRDDGMLVWDAISQWVNNYLRVYYLSDGDVRGDTELAGWVSDVTTNGLVARFPAITSIQQLVDVVTMLIFSASVQHSAVNFPQWPYLSYVPAAPGFSAMPLPSAGVAYTEDDWLAMLPSPLIQVLTVVVTYGLSAVLHRPLGGYVNKDFPFAPAITDTRVTGPGGPLATFRAALAQIEQTIDTRNLQRRYPYPYMRPSQISSSTNI